MQMRILIYQPMLLNRQYCDTKNEVIKAERKLLFALGFVVHVNHPHKLIYAYVNCLGQIENEQLMQRAWNYMNDGLRTDIFLRYRPQTIACACIDLASKSIAKPVPLPREPVPWYEAFGASDRDVQQISLLILQLYSRTRPPNWSRLNETMSQLRNARRSMAVKAADGTSNKRNLDEKVAAIVEMKRREVEDKAAAMQRQNGAGKDKSKEGNKDRESRSMREKENERYNARHSPSSSSHSRSRSRSPLEPKKFRSSSIQKRGVSPEREHNRQRKHNRHHNRRQREEKRRAKEERHAERRRKSRSVERFREDRRKNADKDTRREREKDVYLALGKRRQSSESPPPPAKLRR